MTTLHDLVLPRTGTTTEFDVTGGATTITIPGDPISLPLQVLERTAPRNGYRCWSRRYVAALALGDAVSAVVATIVVTSGLGLNTDPVRYLLSAAFGLLVWPLMIAIMAGYARSRVGIARDETRSVIYAATAVIVGIAFVCGIFGHAAMLKTVVLVVPLLTAIGLLARVIARRSLARSQANGQRLRTVVVAGALASVIALRDRFAAEPDRGLGVVGACVPAADVTAARAAGLVVLGTLDELAAIARRHDCDAIAVASDAVTRDEYLRDLAWSLQADGVELLVDAGLVEVGHGRLHVRPLSGFPLLHVQQPRFEGWQRAVKRTTDVALSSLGLLVVLPLLLAVALLIKCQDGGPVIFRQARVGRDGTPFTMLKFRTMITDAEARKAELLALNESADHLFKIKHDPRITRLGRLLRAFSIDELPQLVNVLGGSMSLVGPRPHLAHEVDAMPALARRRSRVTPGLTGLWQVSGRSDLNETEAVRLDLRYVENWSLGLDLTILWRTASAVLMRRGAH